MHRPAAVIVSLALLGLSACSGNGSGSDAAPVSSQDVSAEATPPIGADAAEQGDTADQGDTGEQGDTGDVASASDVDFCAAIDAIQSAEFELEETFGPEARALFADVQGAAPPELADDVETVIDTLDAIAEVGISEAEDDPVAIDAAFEILLDPDFTEANEHLEEFTSQTCGIDLGAGADLEELDDV